MRYTNNSCFFFDIGPFDDTYQGVDGFIDAIAQNAITCGLLVTQVNPGAQYIGVVPINGYQCIHDDWYSVGGAGIVIDVLPPGCVPVQRLLGTVGAGADVFLSFDVLIQKGVVPIIIEGSGHHVRIGNSAPGTSNPAANLFTIEPYFGAGNVEWQAAMPRLGGSLGSFFQAARGGGYIIKTNDPNNPDNNISIFLSQIVDGPPGVQIVTFKTYTDPDTFLSGNQGTVAFSRLHQSRLFMYGSPVALYLGSVSNPQDHIAMFSLDTSIPITAGGTAISECCFVNIGSLIGNWRVSLQEWGNPTLIRVNGQERRQNLAIGPGQPGLRVNRSGNPNIGITSQWIDGSFVISEAWVDINIATDTKPGNITAPLYDAILTSAHYTNPNIAPTIAFDGKGFLPFTIGGFDSFFCPGGTLCFVADQIFGQ